MRRLLAAVAMLTLLGAPRAAANPFPAIRVDHCQVVPYAGYYLCSTGIPGGKPWICLGYVPGIAGAPSIGVDCV